MRRLLWRLLASYLLIVALAVAAVSWYASRTLQSLYLASVTDELAARARLAASMFAGKFDAASEAEVDRLCDLIGDEIHTRVTVLLPSGLVIGDSAENPLHMENHADRPEVRDALSGRVSVARRYSYTTKRDMLYLAAPVFEQGRLAGVVRVSLPLQDLATTLRSRFGQLALGGAGAALAAALLGLVMARRLARPIAAMTRGAERFAAGELGKPLRVTGPLELETLAGAMNRMAASLDERIRAITAQRNELEAVLSSMVEAVLAVDTDENLVRLNDAARRLFFREGGDPVGRSLPEATRNPDLLRFVRAALAADEPVSADLVLREEDERFLQGHAAPLRDAAGERIGALVVLHDITQIRRLENVRRDFVANVSHELKTPVTSIQGFVETLRDGALADPHAAGRFLEIVARHADRLNAIIEDLLALSRLESDAESREIALAPGAVRPALAAALLTCANKAAERNIAIELECDEALQANLNAALLEQAVVNLIDNAVKCSKDGGVVRVAAAAEQEETAIRVSDDGCGIPREHLPRIFERFYRVDQARSRDLGGTGLGLSIVKHIVNAHGGRISVKSAINQGSEFVIHLPRRSA